MTTTMTRFTGDAVVVLAPEPEPLSVPLVMPPVGVVEGVVLPTSAPRQPPRATAKASAANRSADCETTDLNDMGNPGPKGPEQQILGKRNANATRAAEIQQEQQLTILIAAPREPRWVQSTHQWESRCSRCGRA